MINKLFKLAVLIILCLSAVKLWSMPHYKRKNLLEVISAQPVKIDFGSLSRNYREKDLKTQFHYLNFHCDAERSQPRLGDYVCWSFIESYNEIPSEMIAFFFQDGLLNTIRVSIDHASHPHATSILSNRYGTPKYINRASDIYGQDIVGWYITNGIIVTSSKISHNNEAVIAWLSKEMIIEQLREKLMKSELSGSKEAASL